MDYRGQNYCDIIMKISKGHFYMLFLLVCHTLQEFRVISDK